MRDHAVVVCKKLDKNCAGTNGNVIFDYWSNRPAGEDAAAWFIKRYGEFDPIETAEADFWHEEDHCSSRPRPTPYDPVKAANEQANNLGLPGADEWRQTQDAEFDAGQIGFPYP
jgi:hypothetical protein